MRRDGLLPSRVGGRRSRHARAYFGCTSSTRSNSSPTARRTRARRAFDDILARAEGVLQALGLTYRLLNLCTGDLGTSSARTIDLEVFSPGVDRWLEVSSVSWFRDLPGSASPGSLPHE